MIISRLILAGILLVLLWVPDVLAQVDPSLVPSRRAELEAELREFEKQIDEYQTLIQGKQKEKVSLERDMAILNAQISKAQLDIKRRNLAIENLTNEIGVKSRNISELGGEIIISKEALGKSLQLLRERDDLSLVELAFIYRDVAGFFDALESFNKLQETIQGSLNRLSNLKVSEETTRDDLETRKVEETELKSLQELERRALGKKEVKVQDLLDITKGQESEYKKVLEARQKDAATIRSQLFLLTGSPDIPFEKALELANRAFNKTGTRPAFLLAIITQETELGRNIGQCNLPEDPPKYKWQNIMKPTRDREPYLKITSSLGLDPNLMPLSCPQAGGWGGAMGPAQFIPSTWVLFESAVSKLTGNRPPNPWNPEDAFMASAIFLSDLGADKGTYAAEREAALRYFAGGNWYKPSWAFYGDSVMEIASNIQGEIDILQSLAQR